MSNIIKIKEDYESWIKEISNRFKKSQIRAASKVNREMLSFYWSIGRDISEKYNENTYGKAFYKNLSADLRDLLPDVRSFSITNLKYMRYYFELYVAENRQQPVDDLIYQIPWGHHVQIIGKCKGEQEKALFFVKKVCENNWSRAILLNFLDTNLYER